MSGCISPAKDPEEALHFVWSPVLLIERAIVSQINALLQYMQGAGEESRGNPRIGARVEIVGSHPIHIVDGCADAHCDMEYRVFPSVLAVRERVTGNGGVRKNAGPIPRPDGTKPRPGASQYQRARARGREGVA